MHRFNLRKLLLIMLIAACIAKFFQAPNPITYLLISTLLPCSIGLFSRYAAGKSHDTASAVSFVSAMIIGAVLMTCGSYIRTFVEPSQGILIGGGWNSVLASLIFGSIAGSVCGLFAMLMYITAASIIELLSH